MTQTDKNERIKAAEVSAASLETGIANIESELKEIEGEARILLEGSLKRKQERLREVNRQLATLKA